VSALSTERPSEGATATLAREAGDAADPAVELVDALLEVRAARERLRRVDSILAALLAEIGRHRPQNAKGPTARHGRAPDSRAQLNTHHKLGQPGGSPRCGT
jgi:hypothetical protein